MNLINNLVLVDFKFVAVVGRGGGGGMVVILRTAVVTNLYWTLSWPDCAVDHDRISLLKRGRFRNPVNS